MESATEAVERYKEKQASLKTPRRRSRGRDGSGDAVVKTEKSTTKTKSGMITKTVTVTKTETKNAQGHMSESSSPEASPTVTRKSLRSQKTVEVTKTTGKNTPKKSEPSTASRLKGMLCAPCHMCAAFKPTLKDVPIMILVTCLLVIASSFYIASN